MMVYRGDGFTEHAGAAMLVRAEAMLGAGRGGALCYKNYGVETLDWLQWDLDMRSGS